MGLPSITVAGQPGHVLGLEGALRPAGSQPTTWGRDSSDPGGDPFRSALAGLLEQHGKPINAAQVVLTQPAADAQFFSIRVSALGPTTVRVRWTTLVPRTSIVSVQRPGGEVLLTSPDQQVRTVHDVTVRGLEPGRTYTLRMHGQGPDQAQSPPGQVVTPALPKVTPPIYGRWHAAATKVTESSSWIDTINLDPRHRVVAGVGAEIVRRDQELLMASAWEQLGPVERGRGRTFNRRAPTGMGGIWTIVRPRARTERRSPIRGGRPRAARLRPRSRERLCFGRCGWRTKVRPCCGDSERLAGRNFTAPGS